MVNNGLQEIGETELSSISGGFNLGSYIQYISQAGTVLENIIIIEINL